MYLNHQLFANFPVIDVKYLSMSTQWKAFVSTSPPRDEDLPDCGLWARGFVQGLQYCDCGHWWALCHAPLANEEIILLPVMKWMGTGLPSWVVHAGWVTPEQGTAGMLLTATHSSVIAADGTCIGLHCTCPLLVPCTSLSKVVRGWWNSHPLNVTCAK